MLGNRHWRLLGVVLCAFIWGCSATLSRHATTSPDTSIGVATMDDAGTIVLHLRATVSGGLGDGQLRYPKGHKEYDAVLKHLGGLRPGETKPIPPWQDLR